jgi:flavin reductase
MTIREEFLDAMSGIVSSVAIVTTDGVAGAAGATISAMTSVSADGDAPTMLICLHNETSAAAAILENECFCINVLNHDQSEIADVFAGRIDPPDGNKFKSAEFTNAGSGSAKLGTSRASFDCALKSSERIGTHYVIIGKVLSVSAGSGSPLLYGNRRYTRAD